MQQTSALCLFSLPYTRLYFQSLQYAHFALALKENPEIKRVTVFSAALSDPLHLKISKKPIMLDLPGTKHPVGTAVRIIAVRMTSFTTATSDTPRVEIHCITFAQSDPPMNHHIHTISFLYTRIEIKALMCLWGRVCANWIAKIQIKRIMILMKLKVSRISRLRLC